MLYGINDDVRNTLQHTRIHAHNWKWVNDFPNISTYDNVLISEAVRNRIHL